MKRIYFSLALFACSAATLAAPAAASEVKEDELQMILKQQQELRADLDDGGIDGLTARENKLVRKAQDQVFVLTEGKAALADLSIDELVRLENALESINAQIANTAAAGDGQNVCWRERIVGSNIKETRCGTVAELREAREGARDFLQRPKVCGANCGGQ